MIHNLRENALTLKRIKRKNAIKFILENTRLIISNQIRIIDKTIMFKGIMVMSVETNKVGK
jgi:hypothetical protein